MKRSTLCLSCSQMMITLTTTTTGRAPSTRSPDWQLKMSICRLRNSTRSLPLCKNHSTSSSRRMWCRTDTCAYMLTNLSSLLRAKYSTAFRNLRIRSKPTKPSWMPTLWSKSVERRRASTRLVKVSPKQSHKKICLLVFKLRKRSRTRALRQK